MFVNEDQAARADRRRLLETRQQLRTLENLAARAADALEDCCITQRAKAELVEEIRAALPSRACSSSSSEGAQ